MEERKEWRSLYQINKRIYFLGFKPMQLIILSCLLFVVGYFFWWVAILSFIPLYRVGQMLSRANSSGNPDMILSLFVWYGMKKYFVDGNNIFEKLSHHVDH